jgi:hypothetical protein
MWQALKAFEAAGHLSFLNLHAQHRCIIVTNYSQWLWLETALVNECHDVLSNTDHPCTGWIHKLIIKVRTAIDTRKQSVVFQSKEFIPNMTACPYHYYCTECTQFIEGESDIQALTIHTFKAILKHWLEYPLDDVSEMRCYFITYVI